MACCDFPIAADDCDGAFTVDSSRVTFGRGCLADLERWCGLVAGRGAAEAAQRARMTSATET